MLHLPPEDLIDNNLGHHFLRTYTNNDCIKIVINDMPGRPMKEESKGG
jgi:hypothetical protein